MRDAFLMLGQVSELDKGGLGLFVYKNFWMKNAGRRGRFFRGDSR